MAFDGMMMSLVKEELKKKLVGGHVNQIHQPNKDEFIIHFRTYEGNQKLLLSIRADSPRVNITQYAPENPSTPPMLCMLLRKRLSSAKLIDIIQPENERILFFVFEATNEIGDREKIKLCIEIMGKYSNIILIDKDDNVIDAIKRVDLSMSRERLVLPKVKYEFPKGQNKIELTKESIDEVVEKVNASEYPLDKAILSIVQGISPVITREIEYEVNKGMKLYDVLSDVINILEASSGTPCMLLKEDNMPFDISFLKIKQYGEKALVKEYPSFSELLDAFYYERDLAARMKAKTQGLNKTLATLIERISRKINLQRADLEKYKNREILRIKADVLQANLHKVEKGATSLVTENFYDENGSDIKIELNPAISPAANAQKYYKAYAKAKNGENILGKQIEKSVEDLAYLESVQDAVSRITKEREISEIKSELSEQGFIKIPKGKKSQSALPPIEHEIDGFRVLVGRNNKQNDVLTLKYAKKSDIWLHSKDIPGSHVIIEANGREVPDEVIFEAAKIAAKHSKASKSANVPVDYTKVKNVSKPSGAKPGKVIYVEYKTKYVTPAKENC